MGKTISANAAENIIFYLQFIQKHKKPADLVCLFVTGRQPIRWQEKDRNGHRVPSRMKVIIIH